MPFSLPEYWLHPEGIFTAQLASWEETSGQYGPRVKWVWHTTGVQREDGKTPELSYFTGMSFGAKSNLTAMLIGMKVDVPSTPEEAAAFNPNDYLGTRVRIEVRHKLQTDGSIWANIERFGPVKEEAAKPAPRPAPAPAAPASAPPSGDCDDPDYDHNLQPGDKGHDPFHACSRVKVAA